MKICLVKASDYEEWKYRSNNISLTIGMKADMWVLGDAVPWKEYDVVISFGQVVSKELVGCHPDILWVAYGDSRDTAICFGIRENQERWKSFRN